VLGAGCVVSACGVAYLRNEQETYHLIQTVPRTCRLLSWAATAYCRYQAELAGTSDSRLEPVAFSSLQRRNAQDLAQVCTTVGSARILAPPYHEGSLRAAAHWPHISWCLHALPFPVAIQHVHLWHTKASMICRCAGTMGGFLSRLRSLHLIWRQCLSNIVKSLEHLWKTTASWHPALCMQ
jgi:hypothetical protein